MAMPPSFDPKVASYKPLQWVSNSDHVIRQMIVVDVTVCGNIFTFKPRNEKGCFRWRNSLGCWEERTPSQFSVEVQKVLRQEQTIIFEYSDGIAVIILDDPNPAEPTMAILKSEFAL